MARKSTKPPDTVLMQAILKALWEAKRNGISQEEAKKILTDKFIDVYKNPYLQ